MASLLQQARAQIAEAKKIIEAGENRALASDGPVGHCREELTNAEFDCMWQYVERAYQILLRPPGNQTGRDKLRARMAKERVVNEARKRSEAVKKR